jgi:hypothetical protein
MPYPVPAGSRLLQDLGFLACTLPQVEVCKPTKKPRGQELTGEQQTAHQALHHRRGYPRFRDGTLLCPAQLPGAPDPAAADDLIGINSFIHY